MEIIRGPASSLYGDSAFLGVVNIITRSGASLKGGSVAVETGTLGTQLVRASAGHQLANGVDIALSGMYESSDGVGRLYFPAFDAPATNNGVAEGLDGEGVKQFYGRLTFKGLDVTGAHGIRQRDVPTATYGTQFNTQTWRQETTDHHTLLDIQYGRAIGATRLTFRASYDRFAFWGNFPFDVAEDGTPTVVARAEGLGTRWTFSSGVARALRGRQTLKAGVELIDNYIRHRSQYIGAPEPSLATDRSSTQQRLVQDETNSGVVIITPASLRPHKRSSASRHARRLSSCLRPHNRSSTSRRAFRAKRNELNTVYLVA